MASVMVTDEEAKELKTWVIKKLEDMCVFPLAFAVFFSAETKIHELTVMKTWSSDADSDVLADYVLALIRADTPEPELRTNAIENLEDFLKERGWLFRVLGWLVACPADHGM
jgi:hypothetical protein